MKHPYETMPDPDETMPDQDKDPELEEVYCPICQRQLFKWSDCDEVHCPNCECWVEII